jgi:HEAT repeat protein
MNKELEQLRKLLSEKLSDAEAGAIMGQIAIASKQGAVAIAGDATDNVIITGTQTFASNNRQVVINQGTDPETLMQLFRALLQEIRQGESTDGRSPEDPHEATLAFLQDIEQRFEKISLFHTKQPVILEAQYIPIQVTLESRRRDVEVRSVDREEDDLKQVYAFKGVREEADSGRVDWQKVREENHRQVMVLADPGMGKSTLLRMEARVTARQEYQKLSDGSVAIKHLILPLFLRLSELAKQSEELIEAIPALIQRDYPKTAPPLLPLLMQKLQAGQCLLLLDALDEVPKGERNRIELKAKLDRFVHNYPCPIICTSRIVGYEGNFLENAKEVEIVPFQKAQVEQFVTTWFRNAVDLLGNESASAVGLMRELYSKPQIYGLAQNPLLLSLICSLYQEKGLTLPARRTLVYEKAVEYMLEKWNQTRQSQFPCKGRAKVRLLEALAYHFSCVDQEVFDLDELYDWMEEYLDGQAPRDLKDAGTEALITEFSEVDGILQKLNPDDNQYLFFHRTFQEYLTASYLLRARDGVNLAKAHFWEYDWHETISLMAGLMKDPIPLLQAITDEKDDIFKTQLLLAGRCIAECQPSSHPLIIETLDRLYSFWEQYTDLKFIQSVMVTVGRSHPHLFERFRAILADPRWYEPKAEGKVIYLGPDPLFAALRILGRMGNPSVVPDILAARHAEGGSVWREVAIALEEIGTSEALEALLTLKNNDKFVGRRRRGAWAAIAIERMVSKIKDRTIDPAIRREGIQILSDRHDPVALGTFIEILQDVTEQLEIRQQAAIGLGRLGDARACEVLCKELKDRTELAPSAAWALGQLGQPESVPVLLEALNGNCGDSACQVALALGAIGAVSAVDPLIHVLDNDAHPAQPEAVTALGEMGDPAAIPALARKLNHPKFRRDVISALGKIGTHQSVEILQDCLDQTESKDDYQIVSELITIGTPEALQSLISKLGEQNQELRASVASALGNVENPQAIAALAQYSEDENPRVRQSAIEALLQLNSQKGQEAVLSALFDPELQSWAGERVGMLNCPEVVCCLINFLKDKKIATEIRHLAVRNLGIIRDPQAIEPLIAVLQDQSDDPEVRWQASHSLSRFNTARVVQTLVTALNDVDAGIAGGAAYDLAEMGRPEAVDALVADINSPDAMTRRTAMTSLTGIRHPRANAALVSALKDQDSEIVRRAISGLEKNGSGETLQQLVDDPELDLFTPEIFQLARTLAIRFSRASLSCIPVYPEKVTANRK